MLAVEFPELKKIMVENHISCNWLGWKTGISHDALRRKLTGARELKLSEAILIKQAVKSELPLEELFGRE